MVFILPDHGGTRDAEINVGEKRKKMKDFIKKCELADNLYYIDTKIVDLQYAK